MRAQTLPAGTPVIGELYRVPCLFVPGGYTRWSEHRVLRYQQWVPVLGPKHGDAELGLADQHYHIDWRFVGEGMYRACTDAALGVPNGAVVTSDSPLGRSVWPRQITGTPKMRSLRCLRVMPEFPAGRHLREDRFAEFEAGMLARCVRLVGHTCPHRGLDLRPFVQPDGTAICPGHGLHWDLKTGQLIPRHTLQDAGANG